MKSYHISLLVGLALASGAFLGPRLAQAKDPPDYPALIDALATRNPEPKITHGEPKLVAGFNLKEFDRVRKVLPQLCNDGSEELWEELLKHLGDERYSLTMAFDGENYINWSVGGLCHMLAYKHLAEDVLDRHVSVNRPIRLLRDISDDLGGWRKARSDKSLYELQLEVCELGLAKLDKHPERHILMDGQKEKMRQKIEDELAELKASKKAVYRRLLLGERYDNYPKTPPP